MGGKKRRNEWLCRLLDMKQGAELCVSDSKTKGCYLLGARLTLDFSPGEMMTVPFPSSLRSALHLSHS